MKRKRKVTGYSNETCPACGLDLFFVKERDKPLFGFIPQIGKTEYLVCPVNENHYKVEMGDSSWHMDQHG